MAQLLSEASPAQVRAAIASGITQVTNENRTIDWVLENTPELIQNPLGKELLYGTVRHYFELQRLVEPHLKKPFKNKDLALKHLLLVGAYQLYFSRIPTHAAINETVAACHPLKREWAKGVINAVLRALDRQSKTDQSLGSDGPAWLVREISAQYPQTKEPMLAAQLKRAPMCIRINTSQVSIPDYKAALAAEAISFKLGHIEECLVLEEPIPSLQLPGWQEGWVAVQDQGAQLVGDVFAHLTKEGDRYLDACSAPGGKLFHSLERNARSGRTTNTLLWKYLGLELS